MISQTTIAKLDRLTVVIHHKPSVMGRCQQCKSYQPISHNPQGYCTLYQIRVLPIWSCINLFPVTNLHVAAEQNEQLFD